MDPEVKKNRTRMMMDVYSIIFPYLQTGLTPTEIENNMMELLGYSYKGSYGDGGFSSLIDLLNTHDKIIRLDNGRYTVKSSQETEDIEKLILKQKSTSKKKSIGAPRPFVSKQFVNHTINPRYFEPKRKDNYYENKHHHPNSKHFLNQTINPRYAEPKAKSNNYYENKYNHPNEKHFLNQTINPRFVEHSPNYYYHNTRSNATKKLVDKKLLIVEDAKPVTSLKLKPKKKRTTNDVLEVSGGSVHEVLPDSISCKIPAIVEFKKQVYEMLVEIYPETIMISDMNDMYYQRYGIHVNPLTCYSKTWLFLSKTTFKDFMEVNNGIVQLTKSATSKLNIKSSFFKSNDKDLSMRDRNNDMNEGDDRNHRGFNENRLTYGANFNKTVNQRNSCGDDVLYVNTTNRRTPNDTNVHEDDVRIYRSFNDGRITCEAHFNKTFNYKNNCGDDVLYVNTTNRRTPNDTNGHEDFERIPNNVRELRSSSSHLYKMRQQSEKEDMRLVREAQYSYIDEDSF